MTNAKIKFRPPNPEIKSLVEHHQRKTEAILEVLSELQQRHGHLTRQAIDDVARALSIPANHAYGVASFYSMLSVVDEAPPKTREYTANGGVIRVCDGPVCWLSGSSQVHRELERAARADPNWKVERNSCLGLCDRAPAALVADQQAGPLSVEEADRVLSGWRGQAMDYSQPRPGELRVMMAKAGVVDSDEIESALEHGAYQALEKVLSKEPEKALDEVEASGLAGRGGAGFPVGRKWRFVAQADRYPKYIICNADESEPLIFKDRLLMDSNPHQILEGMAIAGYATGASEAFIYIRGEYPEQAARLERAIQQAEQRNWLGEHIQGSSFSFHVHLHRGAGAYICGEETALIESLEGKRGEPRLRPPYPPTSGYLGLPTLVNNVESFAAVPPILDNGAAWYRTLSTYMTPGTKMYMVLGHVNEPGLFEAPFGLTVRQIIQNFGGGMLPGSTFQFALSGGAAGTIVPRSLLDVPVDYASASKGVSLGAGAFLICDQSVSPVKFLRELLHFFTVESCGKCTPCRVGTYRSLEILDRMTHGRGQRGDVAELHSLAEVMLASSFCGLGQSVPLPMFSAMKHFAQNFDHAETTPENVVGG